MSDEVKLPFTTEWLESCLQSHLGVSSRLTSVAQESLVFGQGYMSYICRLKLKWSDSDQRLPPSLIFKMPSLERLMLAFEQSNDGKAINIGDMEFINVFHRSECIFYSNYRSSDKDIVAITPRCYHNQLVAEGHTGFLLMEDLSSQGRVVEIMDGLNIAQIKSAVVYLAKIHGWSLLNSDWRKEIFPLPPQAFADFPRIWQESHTALKKICPQLYTVSDDVLAVYLRPEMFAAMGAVEYGGSPTATVMGHGDFWTTNLLFKRDLSNPDLCTNDLLAVIDWQNLHPGLCGEDIGRLLVSSCEVPIRRNHLDEILQLYYDTLVAKVHPQTVPFSLADVHRFYHATLGFNSLMYMFGLPILFPVAEKRGKSDRIPDMVGRAVAAMEDGVEALKQLKIIQ